MTDRWLIICRLSPGPFFPKGMTGSSYLDDQVLLLSFSQTYFTPLIDITKADSFIKGRKLTIIDIAAPLGDQSPRLPSGSTQVSLVEQLESRDSLV